LKLPSGNKLTILIVSILLLVTGFGALYEFIIKPFNASMDNMAWGEDAAQARNLCGFVISQVTFDGKSVKEPDQPPIYWCPFRNSAQLDVYGVTNIEKQDQVLTAVKAWQTTNQNMAKLQVRFFERENWKQITNEQSGDVIGHSLPEVLIRESWIVLSNQQTDVLINSTPLKN